MPKMCLLKQISKWLFKRGCVRDVLRSICSHSLRSNVLNSPTASVKMSIDFDPTQPESFGHDYDSSDFDLEILEDLELLKKVMELPEVSEELTTGESGEICVQVGKRKSDRPDLNKKDKVYKGSATKDHLKFKASKSHVKTTEAPAVTTVAVPGAQAEGGLVSQIDALFENRLFRDAPTNRPQQSLPDSVFYFPNAMVNCLNSGNNLGLSDLMRASMDHQCALGIYCFNSMLSPKAFLKFFELLNMVHPDRILRVNSTNSVNNRITASAVMKFTDCRVLFNSVANAVNEPSLLSMFYSRSDHLKRRLYIAEEEERQQMVQMVESDSDLVVYGCLQFHLTFDQYTNKITGLYLAGGLTSAHPASVDIRQA